MVRVYTDSRIVSKVNYLFQEFKRIQEFPFEIDVFEFSDSLKDNLVNDEHVVFYTKQNVDKVGRFLPCNWGSNVSLCDYENIENGIFTKYDPVWLGFYMISRLAEYTIEETGKNIVSYSNRVTDESAHRYDKPFVNLIFKDLESWLLKSGKRIDLNFSQKAKVEFSHDLDYLFKTPQLRLKQSAFKAIRTFNAIGTNKFINELTATVGFFLKSSDYWMFDYWSSFERNNEVSSVFYVYANEGRKKSPRSWLIDPSYDVLSNFRLQEQLRALNNEGFEIGLHGSFNSARSFDLLSREKEVLESALCLAVNKTRQHWLNYVEKITPYIHEKLFKEDSTIGWNNIMGFRAGIASRYRPFDHKNDRAFDHYIIPQIIMDSHLFDYSKVTESEGLESAIKILQCTEGHKNIHYSISWHPNTAHSDFGWHKSYEHLVKYIKR